MDQIKPVPGAQRRGLRASCWRVTVAATVVGTMTAICLGILLGECAAVYVLSVCLSAPKKKWSAQLTVLIVTILKSLLLGTNRGQLSPHTHTNCKGCTQLVFSVSDFKALYPQCRMTRVLCSAPPASPCNSQISSRCPSLPQPSPTTASCSH